MWDHGSRLNSLTATSADENLSDIMLTDTFRHEAVF